MKSIFFFLVILIISFKVQAQTPLDGAVYVVGDSLAYGTGATKTALSPTNCLQKTFPNNTATNLAVPGKKSDTLIGELRTWVDDPKAGLIFVSMGGNDEIMNVIKPNSFPKSASLTNMEESFDNLLARGAIVVYLSLNHPSATTDRLQLITQMAEQKGIITVDGMAGLWGTKYMADNFHPNAQGYEIVCTRINDALRAAGVIQ